MARAYSRTWVTRTVSLVLAVALLGAVADLGLAQRPSRASGSLNTGIESHRRGDYELASRFFEAARAGESDLSAAEKQDLGNYSKKNGDALQARAEGAEQVRKAEQAIREGRPTVAEGLLREVLVNQFVTPADRQWAQKLMAQARPLGTAPSASIPTDGSADPLARARAKLRQARALMAKGDHNAAQQLAREADALGVVYSPGEDTPDRVLTDLAKAKPGAKTDARSMLASARGALDRGELDRAEQLANEADQATSFWSLQTLNPWADTPSKVLRDIQSARTKLAESGKTNPTRPAVTAIKDPEKPKQPAETPRSTATANATTEPGRGFGPLNRIKQWVSPSSPETPPATAKVEDKPAKDTVTAKVENKPPVKDTVTAKVENKPPVASGSSTETARLLLKQGRKALDENNLVRARECVEQARSMKPTLEWWDVDTPDKLMTDINRAEALAAGSKPTTTVASAPRPGLSSDPRVLVKESRELYEAGKLDDSRERALLARSFTSITWGFFEDTPEKLLRDINKAQLKKDRDESDRLMAEARKLYEKGDLDGAETKAYRAERLHGTYTVWDLGDRPQKLVAEIEAARSRNRKVTVPPVPPVQVVQKDAGSRPTENPARVNPPVVIKPDVQVATNDKPPQGTGGNTMTTEPRSSIPPVNAGTQGWPAMPPSRFQGSPAADPVAQTRARDLMAETRRLQKEGKLVEARQKAIECQRLGAILDPREDRPERLLIELGSLCDKRIEILVQEATDFASTGHIDPARFEKAENDLLQAKQLALGFGLDSQVIDQKLTFVMQARSKVQVPGSAVAQSPVAPPVAPPVIPVLTPQVPDPRLTRVQGSEESPQQRGRELLDKARVELRSERLVTARRLAEEVFAGPYSLQNEAAALLRSIDIEEFNQRCLAANRTFDAGMEAVMRKDYSQAAAIFRTVDSHLLRDDRKSKMKDIMLMPEMQPRTLAQASDRAPVIGSATDPGTAVASDRVPSSSPALTRPGVGESYAQQVQAMQEVKFQQMREDALRAQTQATDRFQAGDTDRALEILQEFKVRLHEAKLDSERVVMLEKPVEARLQQFKLLKAQRDTERSRVVQVQTQRERRAKGTLAEQEKQKQVAELMKQYNALFKEGKYREAEMYASRAHELDPDNPIPGAAMYTARIQRRQTEVNGLKDRKENMFVENLNESEDPGPTVNSRDPLAIDKEALKRAMGRKSFANGVELRTRTEKEREIERRLKDPISLDFKDAPLRQVIDDIREYSGVNVVPDRRALDVEGVSLERPLTIKLEGISMQSALRVLLKQVNLTYVIQDDVLQITTEKAARGRMVTRTFPVAELIIPVENYVMPQAANLLRTLGQNGANVQLNGSSTPFPGRTSMGEGTPVSMQGDKANPATFGSGYTPGASPLAPGSLGSTTINTNKQTIEDVLIQLIKSAVAPQSWSDAGGPGTIDFFPLGMALVINQTPDVIEQVFELLEALRRLQELEVAVEVRLITLAESFFERIGLDFAVNVKTDSSTRSFEPQLVTGNNKPGGFLNDLNAPNVLVGMTPAGTLTSDLDIPLRVNSFNRAIPPFGGFPNSPGANGGLSLGLAFLSDIQVFMFMEAAQGDRRTNIMQAPKITMFNGQTSTININDFQFFVTGVTVVQSGGQLVFIPQNNPFPLGVQLGIQAVVSADRRYVRMNMNPNLTNLASASVPLFPITTFITPVFEGGAQGQPVPFTQFIQQPTFTTVGVQTTVSVPDGGTVLLGGLKTLSEGRNEFGPPVLSKIPYVNRLFKNVGYGREAQSLMIMVTPRIIIQAEEEEKATGVVPAPPP